MRDRDPDSRSGTCVLLALDLGTTTLAGRLLCPAGRVLAEARTANPQGALGADILVRLQQAQAGEGATLQALLINGLRELVGQLLGDAGCRPADIAMIAAAGNPGMTCLLRKLPVAGLLFPPHKPPYKELVSIPASEIDLGLAAPLELFPPVSGFVGGDLVAVILGVETRHSTLAERAGLLQEGFPAERRDSPRSGTAPRTDPGTAPGMLLIDIGTNAELALWDGERWRVTSAAAGPAFEGGNIGCGMTLADGAVTAVRLDGDRLRLTVAGDGLPRGLCGSGLASLIAAACEGGLLDPSGRIRAADELDDNLAHCLVRTDGQWAIRWHYSAAGQLLLTQQDVRNFQLAKGAVRAGVAVLLERCGFSAADITQCLVTGALGTALTQEDLKRVALLPEPMVDKTSFVANGVLAGLQAYLTASDGPQRLASLLGRMRSLPLSGTPAFERHFLASLDFG